jgi:hypothetical protein
MDRIFPHILDAADIAGPGPSPKYACSRPSCGMVYRSLAFTRKTPPACPACQQPWLAGAVHITPVQRQMTEKW